VTAMSFVNLYKTPDPVPTSESQLYGPDPYIGKMASVLYRSVSLLSAMIWEYVPM